MLNTPLWWLGLVALLLFFWAVGAYNRLVRLRAAVGKAFAALDEQLLRQLVWLQGSVPAELRDGADELEATRPSPLPADPPASTPPEAAEAGAEARAQIQVEMQAGMPAEMQAEVPAEGVEPPAAATAATAAWARLQAAANQFAVALAQARAKPLQAEHMASLVLAHEAMRTAWQGVLQDAVPPDAVPSPERLQSRWLRLLHQAMPLRTAFNDATQAYNQAIAQFPASLLAWLVGFKPAGSLTRLAEGR